MFSSPVTVVVDGQPHRVFFDRRRYGTTTYTWAIYEKPGGGTIWLGDPWPAVRFPRAELEKAIRNRHYWDKEDAHG